MKNTELSQIAQQLNNNVLSVIGQENLKGFEKAYQIATATSKLKELLTPAYMRPIMELQGNVLGFKTDKDTSGGYPETTVKNCLIEAVLMGLQPYGNQFNIIAGNTYPTKQGLGYLLSNFKGLSYEIIPELPRVNKEHTSAAIVMNVCWSLDNSDRKERRIEIPIKVNKFIGTDAIIGKATRKARAWLYSTITGSEIGEGDVNDLDTPQKRTIDLAAVSEGEETQRVLHHIKKCKTTDELKKVRRSLSPELQKKFSSELQEKRKELIFNSEVNAQAIK